MKGYSLEEMQMSLYGEYGIKVSMNALKRRLSDDKSERKGKKRTGKTRREKNKARNLRFNPVKVMILAFYHHCYYYYYYYYYYYNIYLTYLYLYLHLAINLTIYLNRIQHLYL